MRDKVAQISSFNGLIMQQIIFIINMVLDYSTFNFKDKNTKNEFRKYETTIRLAFNFKRLNNVMSKYYNRKNLVKIKR